MSEHAHKTIVITGAGGGLGPAVVGAFARAGARLAFTDRKQAALDALVDELELPFDRRMAISVDLLDSAAVAAWAEEILDRFGGVDAVVHLVGGYRGHPSISDVTDADWTALREALVDTTLNVARAFSAALKAAAEGRFVTISSPQAQRPTAGNAAYAMAKAAGEALVLALADEFKGTQATANIVVVQAIVTDRMRQEHPDADYAAFTTPEEIAQALLFVCSGAAGAMNGQRMSLHGRA